jgi:hypothetical protein
VQPLRAATECEVDLVRKRLDHGNGLRPRIPKQRLEFHLCATESHPLTWTSPCEDRVSRNGGRLKKTTIVALARKLLVALWKYVTAGVVIEGAIVKSA